MSRRSARKNAFYLVFQSDFMGVENIEQTKEVFFAVNEELSEEDIVFTNELTDGVCANLETIDNFIDKHAKGWSTDRMNKVDLAILRIAVYEMKYTDTPDLVVINEAIELAKKYSDDAVRKMINAVLDKLINEE